MNNDLGKLSTNELGKLFPILLCDPNPAWPSIYLTEKEKIINTVNKGEIIRISHIGSTAIPVIKAKPTIDILLEVAEYFNKEKIIDSFKKLDYHPIPQPENPPPHMMFAKGYTPEGLKGQAFHVHVRYKGDWDELLFRDYLIQNKSIAKEYEELKIELANKHKFNREDYTNAKTAFVKKVMEMVKNQSI